MILVLVDETMVSVNRKLELLESKGFRVSRTKTEYMRYDFSSVGCEDKEVSSEGQIVSKRKTFRYLGSMLISTRMFATGSRHGGLSGGKHLASYTTSSYKKLKVNFIG
jgi:hypothetical protein